MGAADVLAVKRDVVERALWKAKRVKLGIMSGSSTQQESLGQDGSWRAGTALDTPV